MALQAERPALVELRPDRPPGRYHHSTRKLDTQARPQRDTRDRPSPASLTSRRTIRSRPIRRTEDLSAEQSISFRCFKEPFRKLLQSSRRPITASASI